MTLLHALLALAMRSMHSNDRKAKKDAEQRASSRQCHVAVAAADSSADSPAAPVAADSSPDALVGADSPRSLLQELLPAIDIYDAARG